MLNLYSVTKTTGMSIDLRNWIFKPGMVGLVMYLSGKYIYSFFSIFIDAEAWTVAATLTGNISIAVSLMVVVGALDGHELVRLIGLKKR